MRFLSGRAVNLAHTFYDDESVMTVPSVSVTVRAVGETTDAFTGPAVDAGDGLWTVSAGLLTLGQYRVSWVSPEATDTTYFEVQGAFLFSLKEARDSDVDLASTTRFPTSEMKRYRDQVETEFERITGRSFTPRAKTFTFPYLVERQGLYRDTVPVFSTGLYDVTSIKAIRIDGEAVSTDGWSVDPLGYLTGPQNAVQSGSKVVVTVEYGFPAVPADVTRAAILRLRNLFSQENSGIPDRATSFVQAEGGTFTLATPGQRGNETGLPEVDAILRRYRYQLLDDTLGVL